MNPIILCIDLDEWYHARWASGSKRARYPKLLNLFKDYYHSDHPSGEIIKPTEYILKILRSRKIKATFFVLGEVAEWYPRLVRKIAEDGHEIACHGMHHRDLTLSSKNVFENELVKNRKILEKISGQEIIGFRAPNLVVTEWLGKVLINQRFVYDSSICPGRKIKGKYQHQTNVPENPYQTGKNILEKGESGLFEIPIPVFPVLKLPGAVSVATRIFGLKWTEITLNAALKNGAACYYLHPYEFNPPPKLSQMRFKEKIFLRRTGKYMEKIFPIILKRYQNRISSCRGYLEKYENVKIKNRI